MFFINGVILTLTSILMRCVGLVFNIYISNKIGSEAVGVFSLVMSIYLFFVTVANSGLSMAVTCVLSEEFAKGNQKEGLKAIRTGILLALLLGTMAGGFIFLTASSLSSFFMHGLVSSKPFYFIAIGLPFIAMSSCLNGYFSAVRKSYKTAISQVLELIVKILATVCLLSFVISKGVEAICIALILADVISEIFSFTYIFGMYLWDKRKHYTASITCFRQKRKIIKIALPVALTSYIRSGLSTLKQLLIPMQLEKSGLSSSLALSHYGLINGMVMPLLLFSNVFISSFSSLLIPEFSTYLAQDNKKAIHFVCDRIFRITAVFSIGVTGIFLLFSNEISLAVYQNLESSTFLTLLAPLIFFIYVDSIIDSMLKGLNKQLAVMCCNVLDLSMTVLIIYFLLPILGIYGYLISIGISELLNFFVSLTQLLRTTKLTINWFDWLLKPIACAGLGYFCLSFFSFSISSHIISLILNIMLFLVLYLIFCFGAKIIQKKDFFG